MWSVEQFRAAAAERLEPERVDRAVDCVMQAWELVAAEGDDDVVARIGGPARLAHGEDWPCNERGVPLAFLAELHLSRLGPHPGEWARPPVLPVDIRPLRVFADLVDNPFEPCRGWVLPLPDGDTRLVTAPAVPEPWPSGGPWDELDAEDRVLFLPEAETGARPILTMPENDPAAPDGFDTPWYDVAIPLRIEQPPSAVTHDTYPPAWDRSHVFGAPASVQEDARYGAEFVHPGIAEPANWTVLLAIHGDRADILDGGAYHVLVPTADLRVGRWDRVAVDVSSG